MASEKGGRSMRRPLTTWMLGGLLALAGTSWAQGVAPAGEERRGDTTVTTTQTTTTTTVHHETVERANVKTWVITVDGREWEAHPATPAYDGTTGLFHMPTAYTLPKGQFSFQLF